MVFIMRYSWILAMWMKSRCVFWHENGMEQHRHVFELSFGGSEGDISCDVSERLDRIISLLLLFTNASLQMNSTCCTMHEITVYNNAKRTFQTLYSSIFHTSILLNLQPLLIYPLIIQPSLHIHLRPLPCVFRARCSGLCRLPYSFSRIL